MTNSFNNAFSTRSLNSVWGFEKSRLTRSCFGIDRKSGKDFQANLHYELFKIRERVNGKFKASNLLAIAKPKLTGGNRIICVPTISDRLIQFALLTELRPSLVQKGLLNSISYGLVRDANRGVVDARKRALEFRRHHQWVYKADIQKFFDNIPREELKKLTKRAVRRTSLHKIILPFVDCEISDGFDQDWQTIISKAGIVTGHGVRQGMPLSPYFAGIILSPLDKILESRQYRVIRYVDDIVAFFDTKKECDDFHNLLVEQLSEIGLSIGSIGEANSKTNIYEPLQSAEFLGMEICAKNSEGYELRIPQSSIEKVTAKFADSGDIDVLLRKNISLTRLGAYLDSMQSGYHQAYSGAANYNELRAQTENLKEAAMTQVLEELFGEAALSKLSSKKRKFIGVS